MLVMSVINYRVGVGKTTLAANISSGLAKVGYKVLVIDIDHFCNLTGHFFSHSQWKKDCNTTNNTKNFLEYYIKNESVISGNKIIVNAYTENEDFKGQLDIMCSSYELNELNYFLRDYLDTDEKYLKFYSVFKEFLSKYDNKYDFVIFDCPPNTYDIAKTAIMASDYYIIPTKSDEFSKAGIRNLMNDINQFKLDYNKVSTNYKYKINIKNAGIVFTMTEPESNLEKYLIERNHIKEISEEFKNNFIFEIKKNVKLHEEAYDNRMPIVLNKNILSKDYMNLINKLLLNLQKET